MRCEARHALQRLGPRALPRGKRAQVVERLVRRGGGRARMIRRGTLVGRGERDESGRVEAGRRGPGVALHSHFHQLYYKLPKPQNRANPNLIKGINILST